MAKGNKSADIPVLPVEDTQARPASDNAEKKVSFTDLISAMSNGFGEAGTEVGKTEAYKSISRYLHQQVSDISVYNDYNIVVLYDDSTMVKSDADKIYNAVTKFSSGKPMLLVLYSLGGEAASAYLIGKLCREYSADKLVISVPRFAKSAATL